MTTLTWVSEGLEEYVVESRRLADVVNKMVTDFKESYSKIQACCNLISETMLLSIKKKKVYNLEEFLEREEG